MKMYWKSFTQERTETSVSIFALKWRVTGEPLSRVHGHGPSKKKGLHYTLVDVCGRLNSEVRTHSSVWESSFFCYGEGLTFLVLSQKASEFTEVCWLGLLSFLQKLTFGVLFEDMVSLLFFWYVIWDGGGGAVTVILFEVLSITCETQYPLYHRTQLNTWQDSKTACVVTCK